MVAKGCYILLNAKFEHMLPEAHHLPERDLGASWMSHYRNRPYGVFFISHIPGRGGGLFPHLASTRQLLEAHVQLAQSFLTVFFCPPSVCGFKGRGLFIGSHAKNLVAVFGARVRSFEPGRIVSHASSHVIARICLRTVSVIVFESTLDPRLLWRILLAGAVWVRDRVTPRFGYQVGDMTEPCHKPPK